MNENKKKKIVIINITIITLILIALGVTYALWILTKQQTGANVVNTACLDISIDDETGDITLDKAYPILDVEGEKLEPYTFSVHNKCSDLATYQINLESLSKVLEDNRLNPNYIKVKLNEVGQDGIKDVLGSLSLTDTTIADTYEAHKLMSGYLEGNDTKNFELRIWIDENVTVANKDSMNKEFRSKISVTSTYLEENDVPPTGQLALSVCENTITAKATASAYKDGTIEKYEYNIDEKGWQDGSDTQVFTNQENGKHTVKLKLTDSKGTTNEIVQKIDVNYTEPTSVNILGKNISLVKNGDGLYKVGHCGISGTTNDKAFSEEEYRYAGANYTNQDTSYVHNYVKFNNEIWRIIGLVNVKVGDSVEQRVKIVRTDGIDGQNNFGSYAWDKSSSHTNNWTTSKLKDMLNRIYYESGIGECYTNSNGSYSVQSECDFNSGTELPIGLDETAKNMIDKDTIWNIGGNNDYNLNVGQFYEKERGTYTGDNGQYPSEWSSITDETGKHNGIAIIYPSDYGYATSGGNIGRLECFNKNISEWFNESYPGECGINDWLNPSSSDLWVLFPHTPPTTNAFLILPNASVYYGATYITYIVWPTLYLKNTVSITSGEGTMEQPYTLQLDA